MKGTKGVGGGGVSLAYFCLLLKPPVPSSIFLHPCCTQLINKLKLMLYLQCSFLQTYGVVEWQASNGSPRKGLLKLFMKGHFQQWKTESTILSKLNALERHPNIVDYLWHSKSSHTRLDRGHHEHSHLKRRTTVER